MPGRRPLLHMFSPVVPELPGARAKLRRWLEHSVDDPLVRHDLLLAGTELCTEAVQRRGEGHIALRAWVEDHSVVVEVTGPAVDAPSVPSLADGRSDARWRAHILEQVCDEISTAVRGDSRSVQCRRRTQTTQSVG